MQALTVHVQVGRRDRAGNTAAVRVAGLLEDRRTIAVATMIAGETFAHTELEFGLGEAEQLAEACLAGDSRALTTPGLARILSAATAILFRVAVASGAILKIEENHADAGGTGVGGAAEDRVDAEEDANPDD